MKCSEYLWKYVELQRLLKGESPERVQGEMRTILGGKKIVSDTTGEEMTEREALSVLGRNEHDLRRAYELGHRGIFAAICEGQQVSDDEWEAAKEDQGPEDDQEGTEAPEDGGEAVQE